MRSAFVDTIEDNPIIPAVKDDQGLKEALESDIGVVFILYGDICNITEIVNQVKARGKLAMVHIDLIAGLGNKDVSVDFIKERTRADGIITTKHNLAKHAKEIGLFSVLRFFIIDSLALANLEKQAAEAKPDCIEVLPGVMPKVIKKIVENNRIPLIAGGLIADREDVCGALDAGAIAVSSTNKHIWFM